MEKPRVLVVLCARCSSDRLPAKPLVRYGDGINIEWIANRYLSSGSVTDLVIATSNDPSDNALADIMHRRGFDVYRGELNDVADRIYKAALPYKPDIVFRGMGDAPFVDPMFTDMAVDAMLATGAEHGRIYTNNNIPPVYGAGQFPYSWECVERLWRDSRDDQREHFGSLIDHERHAFNLVYVKPPPMYYQKFYRPYRLELDTELDLQLVDRIYDYFRPAPDEVIPLHAVVSYLDDNPDVAGINMSVAEKTGPMTTYTPDTRQEWTDHQTERGFLDWSKSFVFDRALGQNPSAVWCNDSICFLGHVDDQHNVVRPSGDIITKGEIQCQCGAGRTWRERA